MNRYFASCPMGLETLLNEEAKAFNLNPFPGRGGVHLKGEWESLYKFMLWTRIASRIFLNVTEFEITNEKEIVKKVSNFAWEEWFMRDQTLKITTLLDKEAQGTFRNSIYLSQLTKDGMCDRLRDKWGERPNIELQSPDMSFLLRIEKTPKPGYWKCTLSLDLVGMPLHHRGYRGKGHEAPLRENLAAGCVLHTDWNRTEVFMDPFCGSGTILVEAAMIGAGLPPSILRFTHGFAFFNHAYFKRNYAQHDVWMNCVEEMKDTFKKNKVVAESLQLYGNDIAPRALEMVEESLLKLGLSPKIVKLTRQKAQTLSAPAESGIIVTNPPYGKRMEEVEEAQELIHEFGETMKQNFKGFRAYLLLGDPNLRKSIALQTSKRIELRNGDIDSRLVRYNLY